MASKKPDNPNNPPLSLDNDGNIDTSYYLNASIDIIERAAQDMHIDILKADTNRLHYFLKLCCKALYANNKSYLTQINSIIPYTPINIQRLIDIYLDITDRYNALPSIDGFEDYTGIPRDAVGLCEVTPGLKEISKARKRYVQNRLNNHVIGVMSLANNDIDTGLLYTRQNIVTHEAVKRSLSFDDLQRIAQQAPGIGDNNSDQG